MDQNLASIISESLGINISKVDESLSIENCIEWTSLGHMSLIASLEQEYNLKIKDDQVLELTSVKEIMTLLARE